METFLCPKCRGSKYTFSGVKRNQNGMVALLGVPIECIFCLGQGVVTPSQMREYIAFRRSGRLENISELRRTS